MSDAKTDAKAIFLEALDCKSADELRRFLEQACGTAPALRLRVEELLRAHQDAGAFLGGGEQQEATRDQPIVERPGTVIAGRYKLRQEIGEGGMGSVFLAEQTEPVKRQVALKLIKPGMDSKGVLARFESERQALALMDHPHIAKVFDAGSTEGGRPFFVMELVKGIPLTDFCDQHRLGVSDRLALFRQICSAVHHAHQKGIIHRDLKPTNILVESHDSDPVPKVIDFGLAKATSGLQLSEHSVLTAFGSVAGTPLYMAPEQAAFNALDIDTRADIYSLGVILYELLTGSTPIRRETFRQAGLGEMLRLIREVEPPVPSSRISTSDALPSIAATRQTEPLRLSRFVRGDLDWIVMKALAKERDRRYESAIALAQDLERFTNHEPVTAGPPTVSYRFRKFARRNRVALATAGGFTLLLVAATAVSAGLALWANRERARAVKAEAAAKEQQGRAQDREQLAIDAVKRYGDVVRETPELRNNRSLSKLRSTLLKEPQAFFKSLRDRLQADQETTPDSLFRVAAASFDLGKLTAEIGDKEEALRAYEQSLAIQERLVRENPSVARFQFDLAGSHNNIGGLQSQTGRLADALTSYTQAQKIIKPLAGANPQVTLYQRALAVSHMTIGLLQSQTGRIAEAFHSFEQARAIRERLTRENPSVGGFQGELATSQNAIGFLLLETGRPAESLQSYEQARANLERPAVINPPATEFQLDLARSHGGIGAAKRVMGRPAEALASYERARAILERLARDNPSTADFESTLGTTYKAVGALQEALGRPADAHKSYQQALAIFERLARDNPSVTQFQSDLAGNLNALGLLEKAWGNKAEALKLFEQARVIWERQASQNPSDTRAEGLLAASLNNIGDLQSETGQKAKALQSYEQARVIWERQASQNPSDTRAERFLAGSLNNIGLRQSETGQTAKALQSYEQAWCCARIRERPRRCAIPSSPTSPAMWVRQ